MNELLEELKYMRGELTDAYMGYEHKEHLTGLILSRIERVINDFEIEQKESHDAWITTYTGKKFHAFNPKPDQICIKDIAHALSRNNRFTGHSEKSYTVGEHSLHCYNLLTMMGEDETVRLIGLLHDASEAYLQDIASPFKRFLKDYKLAETIVQNAIYMKYLGFLPTEEQYKKVKKVDQIMLVNEMNQLMPHSEYVLPEVEDIHVDTTLDISSKDIAMSFEDFAYRLGARDN